MRLYLDTNILVFLICDNTSLSKDVLEYLFGKHPTPILAV